MDILEVSNLSRATSCYIKVTAPPRHAGKLYSECHALENKKTYEGMFG